MCALGFWSSAETRHTLRRGAQSPTGGFTLIELLVVLAILGLLAAIATPQVVKYLGKAKTDASNIEIKNLSASLDLFVIDVGRYPTEQEGLAALVTKPPGLEAWRGPYINSKGAPLDPWGRPYNYRYPGQHAQYDLYTLGADNAPGGTGENQDVANW
jgi:general secretion pathway protein G